MGDILGRYHYYMVTIYIETYQFVLYNSLYNQILKSNMSSFSNGDIDILSNVEMNEERFLKLLEKLIGESVNLQNNPAQGNNY